MNDSKIMKIALNDRVIEVTDIWVQLDSTFDPQCDVCTQYLEYFKDSLKRIGEFRFTTSQPGLPRDAAGKLVVKVKNDDLESVLEWFAGQMGEVGKYAHVSGLTAVTVDGVRHVLLTDYEEIEE